MFSAALCDHMFAVKADDACCSVAILAPSDRLARSYFLRPTLSLMNGAFATDFDTAACAGGGLQPLAMSKKMTSFELAWIVVSKRDATAMALTGSRALLQFGSLASSGAVVNVHRSLRSHLRGMPFLPRCSHVYATGS